jgi:ABC-type bacteriocin/lantibiotic exporter with double-glycine peptidase domain
MSDAGINLSVLRELCTDMGLPAKAYEFPCDSIANLKVPCIAHLRIGHYVVVQAVDDDTVWITDPQVGVLHLHEREFLHSWSGAVLTIDRAPSNTFRHAYDVPSSGKPRKPFLRLLQFAKPYFSWIVAIASMVALSAVVGLSSPLAVMYLVDKLVVSHDHQGLVLMVAILGALGVTQAISGVVSGLLYSMIANAMLLDMRAKFLRYSQGLSLLDFTRYSAGDLLSRLLNDVAAIQVFLSSSSFGILVNSLAAIVLIIAAFVVNPRLALIGLAPLPIFVFLYYFAYRNLTEYSRRLQVAQSRVTGQAQRILSGLETIKTFCREDLETAMFDQYGVDVWKAAWKMDLLQQVTGGLTIVLASIGPILVLLIGGTDILANRITLGALIGINLLVSRAFEPFIALTQQYSHWRTATGAAERYFEVLDSQSSVQESSDPEPVPTILGAIRFDNVTVDYGQGPVLQSVSAEFKAGSTIALIGPNGGGKSTLLQLIMRHVDPTAGTVFVDGKDVRNYRLFSLRSHIAHVSPNPMLFEGTVYDNIRYGHLHATGAEVSQVVDLVGLTDAIATGKITHNGTNLSAGQRQRISLARALLKRPTVLILDEGTNSLDVQAEHDVLQRIRSFLPKSTIIVVSHRPWVVSSVAHVIYVEGGRILGQGNHNQLVQHCQPYARLWAISQIVAGRRRA